jgi:hypothetical protein
VTNHIMDMILNVGSRAVIPPTPPKFKPIGSILNTGLTHREEDFGYVSNDDETMSTVSEDSYCEESVPLVPRQNLSISKTETYVMKAEELESPTQKHLPLNSLKPFNGSVMPPVKIKTKPDLKIDLEMSIDNVYERWRFITRPEYDSREFPFYTREKFLRENGDLLRRRLERDKRFYKAKARTPDPRPVPQSKSWGIGSIFDALWGK